MKEFLYGFTLGVWRYYGSNSIQLPWLLGALQSGGGVHSVVLEFAKKGAD